MKLTSYIPVTVYPDVPELSLEDYDDGLKLFTRRFLSDFGGKATIYQFGAIRTPGVSDLDVLIITEDQQCARAQEAARNVVNSSGSLKFFFGHQPCVVGESFIPLLPYVHTLQNIARIDGDNDHFENIRHAEPSISDSSRLARHVVWNSFMRIACLELEESAIGLRRTLTLAHNLLEIAVQSNSFLQDPVSIPITTAEIRTSILEEPECKREAAVKMAIESVIKCLTEVDEKLNSTVLVKLEESLDLTGHLNSIHRLAAGNCLYHSNTAPDEQKNFLEQNLANEAQCIKVPNYLALIAVAMIYEVPAFGMVGPHKLKAIPHIYSNQSITQALGLTDYLLKIHSIYELCVQHRIRFDFPRPFNGKVRLHDDSPSGIHRLANRTSSAFSRIRKAFGQ